MRLPRPDRLPRRPAAALLALAAAGLAGRLRSRRDRARRIAELEAAADAGPGRTVGAHDLAELPDPVRRYLAHALREGGPYVETVRVEQTGAVRRDAADPWRPFGATHHVAVDPPGYLWDATVALAPFLSLSVEDEYRGGDGRARLALLDLFPLGGAGPSPELNAAALTRYLAEAVWYPTALLPGAGVEWESIDDRSARATLAHRGATASLVFHFNDRDEVRRVDADERYRRVDGGFEPTPWSGCWRDYRTRNGIRVPTAGEAVWRLPDGDVSVWRGRILGITHRPGPARVAAVRE